MHSKMFFSEDDDENVNIIVEDRLDFELSENLLLYFTVSLI